MAKKVHYHGASSIIKANPEGGGKIKRTKLGGIEIAALNWASNPPPTFPLYPPNVNELFAEANAKGAFKKSRKKRKKAPQPVKAAGR